MRLPAPDGWKMVVWLSASVAWSGYCLALSLFREGPPASLFQQLFNWLFPIGLLYLLLTVGQRRS